MQCTLVLICQSLLLHSHRKEFQEDVVTRDELGSRFLLFFTPMHTVLFVRLPLGQWPPMQAKSSVHLKVIPPCCFWDSEGMLCYELLPCGRDDFVSAPSSRELQTPDS